jgi:oligopeptide/dipeptide ABC transporter ATP-binding protein
MTATPLVEATGLSRHYGLRGSAFAARRVMRAVDDVSLAVASGRNLGIVGESGSGKSTLARLIMALERPSAGTVRFKGEDLFALPAAALRRRRRDFQMVFQDPYGSLDPRQTVARIVAEPLDVAMPGLARAERRAQIAASLGAVGLSADAADRYPHEFSGGQRQRIALARALVTAPSLIVADEPVSALDVSIQAQVLNLLMDLHEQRGVTYIFISHNLAVVELIADEVLVMYRGRVVERGPAKDIFDAPAHPYTRALVDAVPDFAAPAAPASPALPEAAEPPPSGCAFAPRCPRASAICRPEKPSLRDLGAGRQAACHNV